MKQFYRTTTQALIALSIAIGASCSAAAQISFGGTPVSFVQKQGSLRSASAPRTISVAPNFNPDDLRNSLRWDNNIPHQKPLSIGRSIPTNIDLIRDAQRLVYQDGTVVYRLTIRVQEAGSSLLYYQDFYIPQRAGELYIYTPDHKNVLGKYTHETHPYHGSFATEALPGEELILEYVAYNEQELPSIQISSVGHLFNKATTRGMTLEEDEAIAACSPNINCPQGAAWQAQKAGVVQILIHQGADIYKCTGNLLNNTNEDFTPYIITAAHCESNGDVRTSSEADLKQWIFTFHYEKPGCSRGARAFTEAKSMVGCTIKTFLPVVGYSDGLLVQLNQAIPDSYRVYYNGWDSEEKDPTQIVGIHHPNGDAKRIAISNQKVKHATWTWSGISGGGGQGAKEAHFYFFYDEGSTEGGSSGSSIFNEKQLVVGTLTGGSGSCKSQTQYYGRLSNHWDRFKNANDPSRDMGRYLDPKGKGSIRSVRGRWKDEAGFLRPLPSVHLSHLTFKDKTVSLSWQPINRAALAESWSVEYVIYRNGKEIARSQNPSFSENQEKAFAGGTSTVTYGIQAVYDFHGTTDEAKAATRISSKSLSIAPQTTEVTPKLTKTEEGHIKVEWLMPYNLRELSHFGKLTGGETYKPAELKGNILFSKFNGVEKEISLSTKLFIQDHELPAEYTPTNKGELYIHAVRFVPGSIEAAQSCKAYAHVGPNHRSNYYNLGSDIEIPSDWKPGDWVTIYFSRPRKIEFNKSTLFGVLAPNKADNQNIITYIPELDAPGRMTEDCILRGDDFGEDHSYTLRTNDGFFHKQPSGYLALSVLVSYQSAPMTKKAEDRRIVSTSTHMPITSYPNLYIVKRDGKEIARIENNKATQFSHLDKEGGSLDAKYTIEVGYSSQDFAISNEEILPSDQPNVYPSQLGSDAQLHVIQPEQIRSITLYSPEGVLLKKWSKPTPTLDLSDLPQGAYMVLLETTETQLMQRIIR